MFSGFFWVASSASSSACLASRSVGRDPVDVDVQRREAGDLHGEVADELLELVGAGHEVGLAVDLDEHADAAAGVDVARDEALARLAAGLLGGRREALLAEERDGLVEVAVGLGQGALAVHEAGAGPLAQLLDQLRRDVRHACSCLLFSRRRVAARRAVVVWSWWLAAGRAGRSAGRAAAGRRRRLLGRLAGELGGDLLGRRLGGASATAASARATRSPGSRSSSSASGSNDSAAPPARAATSSSVAPGPRRSASGMAIASICSGSVALPGGALAGALDRGVGDERAEQPDRADRVVVGRDDVVELVGVDVRVAGADDRDLELVGLGHARSARGAGRR